MSRHLLFLELKTVSIDGLHRGQKINLIARPECECYREVMSYELPDEAPKSNTPIVFGPFCAIFVITILIGIFSDKKPPDIWFMFFFGSPFVCTALAQLRSGYQWKNMAPGNRGKKRSEDPIGFAASTAGHLILGLAIWGYGIYRHFAAANI